MRRSQWAILAAVIETPDPVQRAWLLDRLQELRDFHSEFVWVHRIAEEVLSRQEMTGEYVDVGELVRAHVLGDM